MPTATDSSSEGLATPGGAGRPDIRLAREASWAKVCRENSMEGTRLTKIARVLADLAAHPGQIAPYLTHGPLSSKKPLELELPWFSFAAIDFLRGFATPQMSVFEYGSGGSTLFFAKRCARVVSTEDNKGWLDLVEGAVGKAGVANVSVRHHPYDFHAAKEFDQSGYLNSIPGEPFQIIVVDGMEREIPVRPTCFYHAEKVIQPGGVIVVDDSWRYPQLRSANRAKSFREFRGVGPCRPGVTSTDIYFY